MLGRYGYFAPSLASTNSTVRNIMCPYVQCSSIYVKHSRNHEFPTMLRVGVFECVYDMWGWWYRKAGVLLERLKVQMGAELLYMYNEWAALGCSAMPRQPVVRVR